LDNNYYIIDFDSTFVSVEALDELCRIALKNSPDKETRLEKFTSITNKAMSGKITFADSLEQRIKLLDAGKDDIDIKKNLQISCKE
jgi:D-3-phosphoglycerate dehydrogenase